MKDQKLTPAEKIVARFIKKIQRNDLQGSEPLTPLVTVKPKSKF